MKTCFITFEYPPEKGGIATSSKRIAHMLKELGLEVYVFTVAGYGQDPHVNRPRQLEYQKIEGIHVYRMKPYAGSLTNVPPQEIQNAAHFLQKLHLEHGFDFFHGMRVNPCGYLASLLGKKFNRKSIVSVRGNDIGRDVFDSGLFHRIKWTLENADEVTFVNGQLKELAELHFNIEDKTQVILNSIEPDRFPEKKQTQRKQFLVGFVGTARRKKGITYLLDAFNEFRQNKDTKLLIIGDFIENEKQDYLQKIKELGLEEDIRITGFISHKKALAYMKELDVFVLPSLSEGCPNSLLEAMYLEIPPIVTDKGGMNEIIENEKEGLVVEAHESEEIRRGLEKIYAQPDLRKKIRKNAKRKIQKNFSPETEKNGWNQAYGIRNQYLPSLTTASSPPVHKKKYRKYVNALNQDNQRLNKISPLEIEIELTFECNLRCQMCDKWRLALARENREQEFFDKYQVMDKKEKWLEEYYGRNEVMDLSHVKELLDQFSEMGVKSILYTGGEPLLHQDIEEILRYTREKDMIPGVVTNGTLLDEKIADTIVETETRTYFSLDGAKAKTHDRIRGKEGVFQGVMQAIRLLKEKDPEAKIRLRYVVQKDNIGEIPEFFELAQELGIEDFSFELVSGEFFDYIDERDYQRLKQILKEIDSKRENAEDKIYWIRNILEEKVTAEKLAQGKPQKELFEKEPVSCYYCSTSTLINAYGDVYPCGYTINPSNKLGNTKKKAFKEIWQGEKYHEFRKKTHPVDIENKNFYSCGDCELHQSFKQIEDSLKSIILIHPSYQPHWSKCEPTGLMQLAGQLEEAGYRPMILDFNVQEIKPRQLLDLIKKEQPLFIGINSLTRQAPHGYRLGEMIKKEVEHIPVVFGGVHPTLLPEETLEKGKADYVLKGEADGSIVEFAHNLLEGKVEKTPGLVYWENDRLVENENHLCTELDELALPAYHLVDMEKYNTNIHLEEYKNEQAVHLLTSRGCPFDCGFCSVPKLFGKRIRYQSVDYVIEHIKFLRREYGIKNFHFHDDIFLLNTERVKKICERIQKEKLDIRWICLASITGVLKASEENALSEMKKAGCVGIEIGVESGDPKVLEEMNKDQGIEEIRKANDALLENEIQPLYLMISYYIGENLDSAYKSARLLYELHHQEKITGKIPAYEKQPYFMGHLTRASPGTDLYEKAGEYGVLYAENWEDHIEEKVGFLPFTLLYDIPAQVEEKNTREFIRRLEKSNLKSYVEKGFYTPASVRKKFKKKKDYYSFLLNIYKYCNGRKRVKDIIEAAGERFSYDHEQVIHALSVLSILRLVKSTRRYQRYVKSLKEKKPLPEGITPHDVELEITYHCNLNCRMCDVRRVGNSRDKTAKYFSKYSHLDAPEEFEKLYNNREEVMDWPMIKNLLHQFKDLGISSVALSGGEPLVHPDISKIIEYASEMDLNGSVFTNGILINEELAELLMKNNWEVSFSIDGPNPEVNDAIRGKGTFKKALKGLWITKKKQKKHNKGHVELHCTIQKENTSSIEKYFQFAKKLGVDDFDFDLVTSEFENRMDEKAYKELCSEFRKIKQKHPNYRKHIPFLDDFLKENMLKEDVMNNISRKNLFKERPVTCFYCCDSVNINPYGDVFPCCYTFNPSSVMGNVTQKNFAEILHNEKFNQFRWGLAPVQFNDEKYESCKHCALYHVFERIQKSMEVKN